MFSQRCIYLWFDQFLNTLYPFGALTSSRTFATWRVSKEEHLDYHLTNTKEKCLMAIVVNCWNGRCYLTVEIIYLELSATSSSLDTIISIFMISSNSQKLGLQERITPSNCKWKAQDFIVRNILFFIKIVSKWNDLPRDIVEAESHQYFNNKLHHYLFNTF